MISFDEAVAIVRGVAKPLESETVPLEDAAGRVLAEPVVSRIDAPRAAVSTMDGYAVREADLVRPPVQLPVVGEAYPGAPCSVPVAAGTCVRIFTGAAIPDGADRVVMQEVVARDGDVATFAKTPSSPRFIRDRASDFARGEVIVAAGRRLDARALVAAAAADVGRVAVARRPRAAIVATGDELRRPGAAAATEAAVPDSITLGLAFFVEACGGMVVERLMLADDLPVMAEAMSALLPRADVIVVTGGASVGERDYARRMFDGLDLLFSKVAIKPGKPVWLGRWGNALVMGLPGNPTSALVTARLLLQPLLAGMGGGDPAATLRWRSVPLATPMEAGGDRETFWRARLEGGRAIPMPNQDSGAQKTLADSDSLVRRSPGAPALEAGAEVDVVDF